MPKNRKKNFKFLLNINQFGTKVAKFSIYFSLVFFDMEARLQKIKNKRKNEKETRMQEIGKKNFWGKFEVNAKVRKV